MVVRKFHETRPDGVNLYRTYSDGGYYLIQNETGAEYGEAIDVESAPYTYTETDKKIEIDPILTEPEPTEEPMAAEADEPTEGG